MYLVITRVLDVTVETWCYEDTERAYEEGNVEYKYFCQPCETLEEVDEKVKIETHGMPLEEYNRLNEGNKWADHIAVLSEDQLPKNFFENLIKLEHGENLKRGISNNESLRSI